MLTVKIAYEEAGRNYRYFLSWRERLFGGYFALLSGLFIAFAWLFNNMPGLIWVPFAAGLLLTLVMWSLELRNRDLYHACQEYAEICESKLPLGTGMFKVIRNKKTWMYHSTTFDIMFAIVTLAMLTGFFLGMMKIICKITNA